MSKIRIKNFGPIKEGYQENGGWMDIKKVTLFIGNQGSGKSTVAKLISTLMWFEKALIRGDVHTQISHKEFIELLQYHKLEDYLEINSEIEYEGDAWRIILTKNNNSTKQFLAANRINKSSVKLPKIMYVPAERNFLSSIKNINKVSNLVAGSLLSYSVEFRNAQLESNGEIIELPINETKVKYDSNEDENYILFGEKRLKLLDASSGFHSVVPLFWVSKYLTDFIKSDEKKLLKLLSSDQTIRRINELKNMNLSSINETEIKAKERKINEKYICKYFVNIVEEPEQNLFPTSQQSVLNELLRYVNEVDENKLIMTTHSPYLINFLTLAVKTYSVFKNVDSNVNKENYRSKEDLILKLNKIVPIKSSINSEDLAIYELDEKEGKIKLLGNYKGLPSDENYLNNNLEDSNELFAQLQEIEKGWR